MYSLKHLKRLPQALSGQQLQRKLRMGLALVAASATLAWACGPEFYSMLQDRKAQLVREFAGDFFFAAKRLQPAPTKPFPQDAASPTDSDKKPADPEYVGLSSAQAATVRAMRGAADGNAAYALGASLQPAVRSYTAGAVDYQLARQGKAQDCEDVSDVEAEAPTEIETVLDDKPTASATEPAAATPASTQASTPQAKPVSKAESTCGKQADHSAADLALARAAKRFNAVLAMKASEGQVRSVWAAYSLGLTHSLLGGEGALVRTDKYYTLTRELAAKGAPDPQFLASDSFGMQALEHLNAGHISRAVELYAEQAAHNSSSGVRSLVVVSKKLLDNPALLQAHIQSPVVQQTVLAYVLAYGNDTDAVDAGLPNASDAQAKGKTSRLQTFTHALEVAGITTLANSDKLAAAAYRFGQYEAAQRYVGKASTPLAHWLRGKLAVRAGKLQEAAAHFSKAVQTSQALGQDKDGLRPTDRARLMAENATLQLSKGDFVQAFDQLFQVGGRYWLDLAYLAERVLTVDELQAYVDQHVPATKPPTEKELAARYENDGGDVQWPALHVNAQLRDLLARRLMREGRYDDALPYFHADGPPVFADADARSHAKDYASALRSAERAWTDVGRAKSLYEAAHIARFKGMDIMGYELGPDYTVVGGNYEAGTPIPKRTDLADKAELSRYEASAAKPEQRYHYRYLAVDLAQRAANALPHQSITYAQVLDNATSWLIDRDAEAAAKVYQQYIAHGPLLPSGKAFGRDPEAPQFWKAHLTQTRQTAHQARLWARHNKPLAWALIGLAAASLGGAAWWLRRRWMQRKAVGVEVAAEEVR